MWAGGMLVDVVADVPLGAETSNPWIQAFVRSTTQASRIRGIASNRGTN